MALGQCAVRWSGPVATFGLGLGLDLGLSASVCALCRRVYRVVVSYPYGSVSGRRKVRLRGGDRDRCGPII